jgi:cytochrome c oxidase subunit IV
MAMSTTSAHAQMSILAHPGYGTFIRVWCVLVTLTGALVALSHLGPRAATWGLLTISPIKAGLVFYYFMHLKYEDPLLKAIMLVALGTLLIFLTLLFADVAFA